MSQIAVKPRALFLVAHSPSPSARQAGQKTAQMHLDKLKLEYEVETIILCSATPEEIENAGRCATTVRIVYFTRLRKVVSVVLGMIRGIPPRFGTRITPGIGRQIAALVREREYRVVWIEYSQLFWLAAHILKAGKGSIKLVLSLQDVQTELVARKSRFERIPFGAWTRAYERRVLRRATTVVVLSGKDRDLVHQISGPAVVTEVSTPVMSDFVYKVKRTADQVRPCSLLFWGAMNRTENYSAALNFAKNVFPSVLKRFPTAVFFIVGANPPRQLQAIGSERVIVTGFLDDPTPYFLQASLGVVPLTEGAGIKLKTLEMLETGLQVVATPIGAEGIPRSGNLVVTDLQNMADVILKCLSLQPG